MINISISGADLKDDTIFNRLKELAEISRGAGCKGVSRGAGTWEERYREIFSKKLVVTKDILARSGLKNEQREEIAEFLIKESGAGEQEEFEGDILAS